MEYPPYVKDLGPVPGFVPGQYARIDLRTGHALQYDTKDPLYKEHQKQRLAEKARRKKLAERARIERAAKREAKKEASRQAALSKLREKQRAIAAKMAALEE